MMVNNDSVKPLIYKNKLFKFDLNLIKSYQIIKNPNFLAKNPNNRFTFP